MGNVLSEERDGIHEQDVQEQEETQHRHSSPLKNEESDSDSDSDSDQLGDIKQQQIRANSLEEFEVDIQNSNKLLKSIINSSGKVIQLKLDIINNGLLKETYLWRLFVRVIVYMIDVNQVGDGSSGSSNIFDKKNIYSVMKYKEYYRFKSTSLDLLDQEDDNTTTHKTTNNNNKVLGNSFSTPSDDECPICLENEATFVSSSCMHRFCEKCLNEWRHKHNTCPICRNINTGEDMDDFILIDHGPSNEELMDYLQKILNRKKKT